jgi:hypothetical protein
MLGALCGANHAVAVLVAVVVAVEPRNRVRYMQADANDDATKTHVYQRVPGVNPRLLVVSIGALDLAHNP